MGQSQSRTAKAAATHPTQSRFLNEYLVFAILMLALGLLVSLTGCSSNPHKAEEIETKIENKGQLSGDTQLGVKDGNMVVQRKVLMSEELRRLQNEVFELEDRVYGSRKYGSKGLYGVLKDCRADLSSKALGGNGKLTFTEPIDRVTDKEEEFKIGLDEKQELVGVSEEFLKDRIERFKKYKVVLQKRQDEYEEKVDICKNDLSQKRAELKVKEDEAKKLGAPQGNAPSGQ